MGWGDGMGGHIPKLPPSPIFVWGVRVSHGATRCHQEPAVRCALGPGAAAETWSTPGTWSTLEHLRMWNTHGTQSTPRSQSTLGAGAPQELEHPPGACQVLEQPVGPGPAAQGRAVPHKPLPSERDFGLLEGCSCPPSLQRPPPEPPAPQQPPPCTGHSPGAVPAPITTKRNPRPWWKPSTAGVSGPCTTAEPQVQQPQTLVPAEMQPGSCCELRAGAVTAKFLPMESTGSAGKALQRSPGPTDANFGKTNSQSPLSRILILNTASHRAPTFSLGSLCPCLATLTV